MVNANNGLLNLACGKGKTVIALHHIAERGVPALVIVNNTTLINQWRDRINQFLDVEGGIGVVQGNPKTWDWEGRGIVLAMLHTLSLRYEELPVGFDRYFGGIYYDEVHHLSAPLFVKAAPMFYGERYGLTATAEREDGLEGVYQYHVGPVFYRDLMPELKARIYFQSVPIHVREHDPAVRAEICDTKGQVNIPKYRGYLGRLVENNEFIRDKIREPLKSGRKVLVLSHSKDQLKLLHQMFPDSGLCTGDEEPESRMSVLREKQVTFGTLQLVKEALDEQTLDTIFFLTPFGSSNIEGGGRNTLQQGMGRILREWKGKKTPVVIIMDHLYIPKFHKMCRHLKVLLNEWPKDQGGPYEYQLLKPYAKGL
jgi:superfamily II DNA or RNA helicase